MKGKRRIDRLIWIIWALTITICLTFTTFSMAAKQTTITFWQSSSEAYQRSYEALADSFHQQNPDITVKAYLLPTVGFKEKLIAAFIAGKEPDVIDNVHDFAVEIEQKYHAWLDLNPYVKDWPEYKLMYPAIRTALTVDGKLYGIQLTDQPLGLFVRKSWMKNVGWDNPYPYIRDWDEMLDLAKKFTFEDPDRNGKDDTWGYEMFGSLSRDYAYVQFNYMINAAGEGIIKEGELNFNTDKGRFVLQRMQDYVFKYKVVPSDTGAYTHVEFYRDVKAGVVGIGRLGPWNMEVFDPALNADYFAIPYPPVKKGETALQTTIYHNLNLSRNTKHLQAGLKWVKFLLGKEAQEMFYVNHGMAYRNDLDWDRLCKSDREKYFKTAEFKRIGEVYPDPRWTRDCRAILAKHVQKCLLDPNANPAKELAAAEKEIRAKYWK